MALSYRSQTYQDTRNQLLELRRQGKLSKDNFQDTLRELGVEPDEFIEADKKFEVARSEGEESFKGEGLIYGVPDFLERMIGRAVGSTVEGIRDVSNAFLPDAVTNTFSDITSGLGEYVPESVKEFSSEFFDPYHGTGTGADAERTIGEIASYFIPATGAVKAVNLGTKGLKLISPGTRAVLTKSARKAGRRGRKAGKVAGYGAAGAFGTTVIEDPRDNLFDMIMEDEQGQEALSKLEKNPSDPTAMDYIEGFIKNAAIEIPAGFALALPVYLRKAYKAKNANQPKQKVSFLGKLDSNISSRLGTDDKTLASIIRRHGAAKASIIEADGIAKDLNKSIVKELGSDSPEVLKKVDAALQYSDLGLQNARQNLSRLQGKQARLVEKINTSTGPQQTKYRNQLNKVREDIAAVNGQIDNLRRNKVDYDEIQRTAPETFSLVNDMRNSIDNLSSYVEQNVVNGKLKARIAGNKGFYLNRSYDVFDDPKFAKQLQQRFDKYKAGEQDDVIDGVAQYLRQSGVDPSDINETLEKLIPATADDTADIFSFLADRSFGTGAGTSKVLSRRGDIADPIKALWGEVKDPMKNYVKTFEKLATIKAEDRFQRELAKDLLEKGIASIGKTDANKINLGDIGKQRLDKILGRGKVDKQMAKTPFQVKVGRKLEDIYIDPIYAKAIQEGLENSSPLSGWAKGFMLAKGLSQTSKTVLSPATHGRNLMGNVAMLAANGIIPGLSSSRKAIEQTASRLANKNNRELAKDAARYAELGITDSGIGVNLIRRNLNSVLKNGAEDWLDKTALTRGTKKTGTFLTNLYQAEDDLFKIIHFEKTKDYIRKAFPDKSLKEVEEIAAQRTRDMMPNYSLVPRFVKDLRGAPIGDFIAFPAEMIRTSKNLVKYTVQDLTSGNAELRKQAAKRLAGMTAVGTGGDALSEHSRQVFNISDDQEEAIDGLVPSYEQFQDRIYLSGINKDKRGNVGVNYINLGPLDPYAYLKTAAKAAHKMVFDGGLNSAELEGMAISMFDNQLGPFMEPSMVTKALFDLANGRNYSNEPTMMGKLQKAAGIAIDPFKPGVMSFLNKRMQYEQTKAGTNKIVSPLFGEFGDGKNLPEGVTPSSFTISGYDQTFGGDVGLPAFFGVRNQRLDLTAGLEYALNPTIGMINSSDKKFQQLIRDPSLYSESDEKQIFNAYLDGQKLRLKGFQELKALSDNYRTLFGDDYAKEIAKGMKLRGKKKVSPDVFKYLNYAASNRYLPTFPDFGVSERRSAAPIPRQKIREAYRALSGNKIEED